jgi:hypothetical protein
MKFQDWIFIFPAIVGIISGVLAVIVTLEPPESTVSKKIWIFLFVLLAILTFLGIIWQQKITKAKKKQDRSILFLK